MVPRSGARGLLRGPGGEGSALLRVEGLERATAVNVGDEVVCSGLGAAFPRGTRVGVVEQVEMPEGSLTATALVRPAVEFDRLANVLVILAPEQGARARARARARRRRGRGATSVAPHPGPARPGWIGTWTCHFPAVGVAAAGAGAGVAAGAAAETLNSIAGRFSSGVLALPFS